MPVSEEPMHRCTPIHPQLDKGADSLRAGFCSQIHRALYAQYWPAVPTDNDHWPSVATPTARSFMVAFVCSPVVRGCGVVRQVPVREYRSSSVWPLGASCPEIDSATKRSSVRTSRMVMSIVMIHKIVVK